MKFVVSGVPECLREVGCYVAFKLDYFLDCSSWTLLNVSSWKKERKKERKKEEEEKEKDRGKAKWYGYFSW